MMVYNRAGLALAVELELQYIYVLYSTVYTVSWGSGVGRAAGSWLKKRSEAERIAWVKKEQQTIRQPSYVAAQYSTVQSQGNQKRPKLYADEMASDGEC